MGAENILFLDFDGVICNSIDECLVSSAVGYHKYYKGLEPGPIDKKMKEKFMRLRIFIRSGEDYIAIHKLLEEGVVIESQEHFDNYTGSLGAKQMAIFKEFFYKGREHVINNAFRYWCQLNPLYPHMKEHLPRYISNENLYILSTKRPQYIIAILKYHGMDIKIDRVLYSSKQSKYDIIGGIMDHHPGSIAHFVDDQIDHFKQKEDSRITPYLADWGFINPAWLDEPFTTLKAEEMEGIFRLI